MEQETAPTSREAHDTTTNRRLTRSAGLAGLATLASRILGLARESVFAALFGAGNELDAFLVAFRIPNLARDLFAEGAMSSAFVPTFARYVTVRGKTDAWRLGNNVINTIALASGTLVVVGIIFATPLVTLYAGDYATVPGKLELTVQLTRVMLPFLILVAIAAAVMGMLNSLHHYFLPALSPAMFNVASITCAIGLTPVMPLLGMPRIMGAAIGALLGGFGQIAIQWRALRLEGFRYQPLFDLKDEGLQRVLLLMGPGTLGLAATQVNLFVNTLLAVKEGTGAVSWLTYAFRLMYLPIGLFGVSIATAVLPHAALQGAQGDHRAIRWTVSRGLALMLAVNIPAMFGLMVLADPIVRLLLEHGRFLPPDTVATAQALRFYAIGLLGYSAARIASPVFYAVGQNRIPVFVSFATIAFNLLASLVLVQPLGFRGLALGTSLAALANGGLLIWLLRRPLGGIDGSHLLYTFTKTSLAATIMAWVASIVHRRTALLIGTERLPGEVLTLAVAITSALAVLGLAAKLLRIREFDEVFAIGRDQLRKLRLS